MAADRTRLSRSAGRRQVRPVSTWALTEFCERNGLSLSSGFTRAVARSLISPAKPLPDIAPTGTWFDKVVAYMNAKRYFICRHPDCKNIVYLEGVNRDGTLNDDEPNKFNDLRIVFSVGEDGRVDLENSCWDGTTEPGKFWTVKPMNPKGAARIAFNQYKAWVVGIHQPSPASAHEALVQVEPVTVYRDLNKDFKRTGDVPDHGLFGINQHWGYDAPKDDLGGTSAVASSAVPEKGIESSCRSSRATPATLRTTPIGSCGGASRRRSTLGLRARCCHDLRAHQHKSDAAAGARSECACRLPGACRAITATAAPRRLWCLPCPPGPEFRLRSSSPACSSCCSGRHSCISPSQTGSAPIPP
jgi:hypothetical protein